MQITIHAVLLTTSLVIIMPLLVMLSSAFKNEVEIFTFPLKLFPNPIRTINFAQLTAFPLYIWNSVKITVSIVLLQLATASTAAYAFAKLDWKGRDLIFLLFISSMMIPAQVPIIHQFVIIRRLGLYDTHLALIAMGSFSALGTFMIRQHFMTIPDALLESARMDGASEFYIFSHIMLPLARPALMALVVFSFRYFWNDFFIPMIFLSSENLKTVPLGISDFVTQYMVYYGPQMAACLISIAPVLIVFAAAQRYFVQGIASGSVRN